MSVQERGLSSQAGHGRGFRGEPAGPTERTLEFGRTPLQTFPVMGAKDRQRQTLVRAFAAGSRGRSWERAEGAEHFEARSRKRRGGAPGIHGPRAGQCLLAEKKVPGGSHGFQALETYS